MANVSPDLVWGIVRDTSSFIIKKRQSGRSGMGKRGAEFTTEPNNVASKNAWKYSGLANAKTVSLEPTEGGVVLTTKTKNSARAGKVRRCNLCSSACMASLRLAVQCQFFTERC